MEEDEDRRPLILFGRDVTLIPCFRSSFLYGFGSGIVGGLVTFMFTSRPRLASHMSVATFVGSTWSYWMYCRYNWSKQKLDAARLQALIEQQSALEGTPSEKRLEMKPLPLVEV